MYREIRPALSLVLLFTLALGVALPTAFTGLAQALFPFQANGSLISHDGQFIGSALIGQNFTGPDWFTPRPSALTGTNASGKTIATPYNAAESGGSASGPTNASMIANVKTRIAAYRTAYGQGPVPDDAVTTSGSGLDPDISLENAARQAPAIAAARKLPPAAVTALISRLAHHRILGIIGTDQVNVLKLNLALSRLAAP
ncbi:MAG: potassium-transporting ATPase subunit KdpC [Acidiphilium sp.]|nr:potassium-transporting ATPase subunit KdpC [Acidiphilium sp.]